MGWSEDQAWEMNWWSSCCNTLGEKLKQITYINRMGIGWEVDSNGAKIFVKAKDISVIDIGGGPDSVLLQSRPSVRGAVVDPGDYPQWTRDRYKAAGITLYHMKGEDISSAVGVYDEAWIYNCLQHVESPDAIIANVKKICKIIRIIEPIDIPSCLGHPHCLTSVWLDTMLGGCGNVADINENGFACKCYYGVFSVNGEDR